MKPCLGLHFVIEGKNQYADKLKLLYNGKKMSGLNGWYRVKDKLRT